MKSPIKATLVTFDEKGNQVGKAKNLFAHFASGEPSGPLVEVILEEGEYGEHTSVYLEYKSLIKELNKKG